ncbi:acyl-protein synthetase [Spirochaetia bacterium]|nr:acyl-protein synthetase [Spirochaetia bacterium]GHV45759.1 acyl-protein synthetase [Spirochaetia bacterium]
MDLSDIISIPPYSLSKTKKRELLNERLRFLTCHHYEKCESYKKIIDTIGITIHDLPEYDGLPFLPVRLFKAFDLLSIDKNEVVKTLTSSGTTGQQVSRIFLDKNNSIGQTKVLTSIVSSYIGNKRLPLIILDSSNVIKNRSMFSARGAGILGFSLFGSKKMYVFDDDMNLDVSQLQQFLTEHKENPVFMFGFTFMIWQYFYKELKKTGYRPDLSRAILIHGGGWKKLIAESVEPEIFKHSLYDVCGILPQNIHDYYGMVEQTGTIYIECEYGHLHTPVFSDVLIRRPEDFSLADHGEKGIIEVVSVLPESYPGHALLTEDEGEILGEDDCPCGRLGKYFKIHGRVKGAEIRGCSDTYEQY